MKKGTIILTRFPFTDLSSRKRRPAIIVSKVDKNKKDIIVAFISSVIPNKISKTDLVINKYDKYFDITGLRKKSVFKMDKLATLEKSIFTGELGAVSNKVLTNINEKLLIALDIKLIKK